MFFFCYTNCIPSILLHCLCCYIGYLCLLLRHSFCYFCYMDSVCAVFYNKNCLCYILLHGSFRSLYAGYWSSVLFRVMFCYTNVLGLVYNRIICVIFCYTISSYPVSLRAYSVYRVLLRELFVLYFVTRFVLFFFFFSVHRLFVPCFVTRVLSR